MRVPYALLVSVFVIATCGLVYELIAGTLASYLLGDSVFQFSTVIGTYLFAMGVGSFLSRYVQGNLAARFVLIELLIGVVGGTSAALLFTLFEHVSAFGVLLYGIVLLTGILVGVEIPLMMRLLQDRFTFTDLVAQVFAFDYVGALLASLLFPLVLVPQLGLVRSAFFFGIVNAAVGLWTLWLFREQAGGWGRPLLVLGVAVTLALGVGFAYGDRILESAETEAYPDAVIYSKQTPYQRIVLTSGGGDLRLYLNGNLQFSSEDEYRYHEALVHPGLARLPQARRVLILGGGDGLAAREVLRYRQVSDVTLVDLDPAMTALFASHPTLTQLNRGALSDPRLRVVNADAFTWLRAQSAQYDFIVVDFPDPSNFSLGKLYSQTFYRLLRQRLAPGGALVVQSTSPWVARQAYWCVDATLRSVGLMTEPYHAHVPSFGEWGFVLASAAPMPAITATTAQWPDSLRFASAEGWVAMRQFAPDIGPTPVEVNRLNNQVLVQYFTKAWGAYE